VLKENFAITKVDKLSHNLALICKKLHLHKLYTEIHSDQKLLGVICIDQKLLGE